MQACPSRHLSPVSPAASFTDGDDFTTFIDIQGVEDFHGEMDFKVAGTKKGITAIQMDLKNDGLTHGHHQERP